jgi:hypothetical protein
MRVPIIIRHQPIREMGTSSSNKRSIIHTDNCTTRIQVSAVVPHKTLCRQHLTFSFPRRRAPESPWQRFQPLGASSITDDARIIVIVFIIITWLQFNSTRHGSAAALLGVECSRRQQFQFTTTFALASRHHCTGLIIWLLRHLLIPRYVFIGLRRMIKDYVSSLPLCIYEPRSKKRLTETHLFFAILLIVFMLMSLFFSKEDVLKEMKFADPVVFK